MQRAAREKHPERKVTALLVIGILLAPGIFVWFLLRQGHSTLARAIGFSWAGLLTLATIAFVSAGPPSQAADEDHLAAATGQSEREPVVAEKQAVSADRFDGRDFETEAVVFCEQRIKESLVSSSSFKTRGTWQFTHYGSIGTVRRNYSATNGFGARLDARYRCKYDAETQSILALSILGPYGKRVIVSNDAPPVDELTNDQKDARQELTMEGAARAANSSNIAQPTGSKPVRWITNFQMMGCPEASDWFPMQEAVERDDMSVDLPDRCIEIEAGTVVVTPSKGKRETVTHNGHAYEKGQLEDGRVFWTDEMRSARRLTPL